MKLRNQKEWKEYCLSGKKPNNIPSNPNRKYKNKGWISLGDWLGTGVIAASKINFISYKESKNYISNLNLKSAKEWKEYCLSGKKPNNIPSNPQKTYKKKGWNSWGEFLGTGVIGKQKMEFMNYNSAKKYVSRLNLNSVNEWRNYTKSGLKPKNIPVAPNEVYQSKGWTNWKDFLGKED